MNLRKKHLFGLIIFTFLMVPVAFSQSGQVEKALKKKEKVERSYEKAYEKARKKTIKHRRQIQTQETKKRMKEADKLARQYNKQGEPGFFERFFSKNKRKK